MELVNADNMSIDQLKKYAETLNWEKVPEYNHIDWENDDMLVIRSKIKAVINNIAEKGK